MAAVLNKHHTNPPVVTAEMMFADIVPRKTLSS
jgi:hypothetical protein